LKNSEELCKIIYDVRKTDSENGSELCFLIHCSELESVTGQSTKTNNESPAENISKTMLGHVYEMPVSLTAQLASTELTFEEIMNLDVNDILLLDKKVDEPIELIVEDRIFFYGQPAKSAGTYAVVITKPAYNTE